MRAGIGAECDREVVAADVILAAEVQRAGQLERQQLEQRLRQVADAHRRSDLVDEERRPLARQALLRPGLGTAVEERGAGDRRGGMRRADAPLGLGFRPAVRAHRPDSVVFAVAAAQPVEDQVGRDVDQPHAHRGAGDAVGALDVCRPFVVALAVRGVDDGIHIPRRRHHRRLVAHVGVHPIDREVGLRRPPRRAHLPPARGSTPHELAAEQAAAAGDQQSRQGIAESCAWIDPPHDSTT